jgi:hypothetical protein
MSPAPHLLLSHSKEYSASTCTVRIDGGNTTLHTEREELVLKLIGEPKPIWQLILLFLRRSYCALVSDGDGNLVDGVLVPSSMNCALLHIGRVLLSISLPGLRLAGLSWESFQEATQQKCSGVCEFVSLMWTQNFSGTGD